MAIISWTQGNTYDALALNLTNADGSVVPLTSVTSSNITLHMRPLIPISNYVTLSGTVTILSAVAGQIAFQFTPSDVAVAGQYGLVVQVQFGSTLLPLFEQTLIIQRAI